MNRSRRAGEESPTQYRCTGRDPRGLSTIDDDSWERSGERRGGLVASPAFDGDLFDAVVGAHGHRVPDRARGSQNPVLYWPRFLVPLRYGVLVTGLFPNAVTQAPLAAANLLGANLVYRGAESMNSLKHLGVPIVAIGTPENPEDILRWQHNGAVRSICLRGGTIVGAQLAGDIRAPGVYRSLMLRRADVSRYRRRQIEPGFGIGDITWDALHAIPVTANR